MVRDFESELEKIDSVIDQLASIATSDGRVTSEEQSLLDEIMNELSNYRQLVLEALEDNEVTDDESKAMKDALDKIVETASKFAMADGNISSDEEDLIDTLISFAN